MRRRIQQSSSELVVFTFSLIVYLLTMDRSASWWDCGEFITTGYGLMVGHPPGAPVYQLITHCFMTLSFGNPLWVAPLSNFVSVLCAALTVMLLYKTIQLFLESRFSQSSTLPAAIGALCYLFCDTAWFSAVESEVYSMAMFFCALTIWLILRWEQSGNHRLLLLIGLLLGLGVGVHFMTLLVTPFLLWIFVRKVRREKKEGKPLSFHFLHLISIFLFFLLGLTPYAIIPLRAASNPPINEGNPASCEDFHRYLGRDQYEKAPLYPRMWRERDASNWAEWGGNRQSLWDNTKYWFTYQFGYMYCRYLMYNFIGRENLAYKPDRKGFSFFNFHYSIFILPFLLGMWGMWVHRRRRGDFHALLLLFLFGGIILNFYLNHPCYEPRSRDYVYILSFYTFAIWIGIGAANLISNVESRISEKKHCKKFIIHNLQFILFLAPLLMAVGNWSDHDRHNCHSVHDISMAHLESCDPDAILITYGDNDTFPLWYLKYVEHQRTDIDIVNINLAGYQQVWRIISGNAFRRPVYFSLYAYDQLKVHFPNRLRCEGFCWRLLPSPWDVDNLEPLRRHVATIQWHITDDEYICHVSKHFLDDWKKIVGGL